MSFINPIPVRVCAEHYLYLDFLTTVLLYLVETLALKKILGIVLAWKSGLKLPFLTLECYCPLQTILLSDLVGWQPSADSNSLLVHHNYQQRAVTPYPESLNSNKKGAKLPLLSAEGCHSRLDGQHCPLIKYQGVFFKGEKTLWWYI